MNIGILSFNENKTTSFKKELQLLYPSLNLRILSSPREVEYSLRLDLLLLDLCSGSFLKNSSQKSKIAAFKNEFVIGAILPEDHDSEVWQTILDFEIDIIFYYPLKTNQVRQQISVCKKLLNEISIRKIDKQSSEIVNGCTENYFNVFENFSQFSEKEYFNAIAKYISMSMDLDSVFVGEHLFDSNSINVIGGYHLGKPVDDMSYGLEGTPCAQVLNKNMCVFGEGVQELFPEDILLKELDIEGYIGYPLFDKNRRPIGVLVGTKSRPIRNSNYILSNLRFFSDMISVEILRNRAEKELNKSLIELNKAQKVAKVGSWYWDLSDNSIQWSDEMYNIYGLPKTITDKINTVGQLVVKEDQGIFTNAIASLYRNNTPESIQYRILRNGKEIVHINANLELIKDEKNEITHMVGTVQDITDTNKTSEALKISEDRFKWAMHMSQEGIFDWNLTDNTIFFSSNWYKMLGYKEGELESSPKVLEELIAPWDLEKYQNTHRKLINNEISRYGLEVQIKHKNGEWIDILVKAGILFNEKKTPIRLIGTIGDITRLKNAQKSIKEEKQRVENILEGTNAGAWEWDISSGNIYINNRWAEIIGYEKSEIEPITPDFLGKSAHPEDIERIRKEVRSVVEKQSNSIDVEFRLLHKKGNWVWVNSRANVVKRDSKGNPETVSGIHLDITKQKKTTVELQNAKLKAEESDRLKTAFLANMSHELRTPMNGILGFLDLINNEELTEIEQKQYLGIVEKNSKRLLTTINDIIEISIIESGDIPLRYASFDLHEVMKDFYQFLSPEAKDKGLNLILDIQNIDSPFLIETDKNKLESNLTNLIKNAIKYTKEGYVKFGYSLTKDFIEFYVEDTGLGIREDELHIIFDRFVQTDLNRISDNNGSGLGLPITKAYTEKLGGKIWLDSEYGKGTTFYFTIKRYN